MQTTIAVNLFFVLLYLRKKIITVKMKICLQNFIIGSTW